MELVLIMLVFLFTTVLVVAVGSLIVNRRGQVKDRLTSISKMKVDADPEELLRLPFMQRVVSPALSSLGHFFGRAAPWEIRSRVDKRIMYAGNPWNFNFYSLFAVQILLGAAFFLLFLFLLRFIQVYDGRMIFINILLALVGFYMPYFIVSSKADDRQKKIRRALPDVLDLLLVSVEAGLGFDMALKRVAQQMPGPLSEEIKRALDEIRMGGNREAAFRGIVRRCGVSEVSSFLSSIIQAEQLGSNIANTLRVQADFMRQKRRQLAQEMAMKAPVKLVFPLIIFILPALFVVVVGPAVIRVFQMFLIMQ